MSTHQPRDAPATSFEVEPHLQNIYNQEQFGIVLVAAWPPNESFLKPYKEFINEVKGCFDPSDLEVPSENDKEGTSSGGVRQQQPNVYLYPPHHMHITVATFHPFNKPFNNDGNATKTKMTAFETSTAEDRDLYSRACGQIVQNAMKRNDWPKHPFYLKVDRAQIGEKAGILLYRDDDESSEKQGSLRKIRKILKEEYAKVVMAESQKILKGRELIIPGIIHSTFLRFAGEPNTDGRVIQEKFQALVVENDKGEKANKMKNCFFKEQICVNSIKLVVEKRAYMHIQCNSDNVLESSNL